MAEWKQLEIDRLNGLLIRQAEVIEKIQDERDALKDLLRAVRACVPMYASHWGLRDRIDAAIDAARGE